MQYINLIKQEQTHNLKVCEVKNTSLYLKMPQCQAFIMLYNFQGRNVSVFAFVRFAIPPTV